MNRKQHLDDYEKAIEENLEHQGTLENLAEEMAFLRKAAHKHGALKKSITLRIHERDLEAMRLKASKNGVPYQTYINMLIHQDALSL